MRFCFIGFLYLTRHSSAFYSSLENDAELLTLYTHTCPFHQQNFQVGFTASRCGGMIWGGDLILKADFRCRSKVFPSFDLPSEKSST